MEKSRFIMGVTFLIITVMTTLTESLAIANNDSMNKTEKLESLAEKMARYRLPNCTIPRLYKITLEPDITNDDLTWNGESSIDFEVLRSTNVITLHAFENLEIEENFTNLVDRDGNVFVPNEHTRDNEVEFLKLNFHQDISVGNYSLNIRYHGVDTRQIVGFYQASADPPSAATHFEATTARRAFPCWDEPSLKAQFKMSIKHDKKYKAISNMPEIERITTEDGKTLTNFETTPVMSTYLLTFVIAEYESISNEFGNVTVWTQKDGLEEFRHILDTSQKVVDFMVAYTGLDPGVSRIGSVTVPWYTASATEHWGLVSYSTETIRFNSSTDTTMKLDRINLLIAHELSHSWFGNRVSPRWWNDLWLNEAFAAYFQYVIMDEINGNSTDLGLFLVRNNQENAFILDERETNTYVRWTPITNIEIRRLFGPVTYRKGAAIVHMFRNVLTEDVFRAGIQNYLSKHSYSAVEADELMAALQEAYDEKTPGTLNVKETMMSWLMQTGCPVINVTRNYTTGDTKVTQQSTLVGETKKWWIPLNWATKTDLNFSSTTPSNWMSNVNDSVTISGIDKDDWVIFNVQASGYYRVNYDDENWRRIIDYMNTDNYKNIHVLNRVQLLNDILILAQKEPSRYGKYFAQLTKYLAREVEYVPWHVAKNAMRSYEFSVRGTKLHRTFQKYMLGLMNSLIEKVGYETRPDDDYVTKLSKQDLIAWACESGHAGCADFAVQKLLRFIEDPTNNRLHPDNRGAIFCAGLGGLNGTSAKRVMDWALENAKDELLTNLGCTDNHEIHRSFLNSVKDDIRRPDLPIMSTALYNILDSSDANFNFIIDFVVENFPANITNTASRFPDRERFARNIFRFVKTNSRLEKLKTFLELNIAESKESWKTELLIEAEQTVADTEMYTAHVRVLYDLPLLPDDLINNSTIETL